MSLGAGDKAASWAASLPLWYATLQADASDSAPMVYLHHPISAGR